MRWTCFFFASDRDPLRWARGQVGTDWKSIFLSLIQNALKSIGFRAFLCHFQIWKFLKSCKSLLGRLYQGTSKPSSETSRHSFDGIHKTVCGVWIPIHYRLFYHMGDPIFPAQRGHPRPLYRDQTIACHSNPQLAHCHHTLRLLPTVTS